MNRHRQNGVWPDTALSRAYLVALGKWVVTNQDDDGAKVALPIGVVGIEELTKVMRQQMSSSPQQEEN
jgi:hypothetical protein